MKTRIEYPKYSAFYKTCINCKDIFVIRKTICATEFSKLRFVTCKSTIIGNLLRKRRNDILEYIDYVC